MVDADLLLSKLSDPAFANQLMSAAQEGHKEEVERLIKSVGSQSAIITQYTPSGVQFTIDPNGEETPCCTLSMTLKWGE
jgi:hypothetical protein